MPSIAHPTLLDRTYRSASLPTRSLALGLLALFFWVTASQAREVPFAPAFVDNKITGARDALATDIDGDGDGDIVAAATGAVGVVLYRNTAGDGSVWTRLDVDSSFDGAFAVAVGDMNLDGHPDILSVAHADNDISWWENNGSGTAWTRRNVDFSFNGASDIEAADIDGDGDLDIVATADGDDDIAWWENTNGAGTAWTKRDIDTSFDAARAVKVADLDNDGDLDVVATGDFVSTVNWWENTTGNGLNWTEHTIDFSHSGGSGVDVADMDGDGDIDVFGSAEAGDEITWYANPHISGGARSGGPSSENFGTWTETTIDNSLNGAYGVHAVDLDGDGDIDVLGAARNEAGGSNIDVAYYENLGDNVTFSKRRVAGFFDNARSVSTFDIDKDGDLDITSSSPNLTEISWWMAETIHTSVTYPEETTLDDTFMGSRSVDAGDLDGDGDLDIIACAFDDDEVAWWENTNGDGSNWSMRIVDQAFDGARSVEAADMDGDGDLDIVGSAQFDNDIVWYENLDGSGTSWSKHIVETNFLGARRAVTVDLDRDGDIDILGAAADAKDITWYRNNGDGSSFVPDIIEDNYDRAISTFAADIDGDGDIDALGAADSIDDITWWENLDGVGGMWSTAKTIDSFYSQPGFVSAADMDCDGDIDVLGAAEGGDEITWWENDNGDGSAWTKHTVDSFNQATSVLAADFDADGDPDLLGSAFKDGGKIHLWLNNGDALSWTELVITDDFYGAGWVEAADMDRDGDLDVMATAERDDFVSYWDNRGGQFALATADTSGNTLGNSVTKSLLTITATHNGKAGEQDLELTTLEILFEETPGVPLTTSEANSIIDNLFVYRDGGNGTFDMGSDTLVTTLGSLSLTDGVQSVPFADGDANVAVSQGSPVAFFVVVETTSNYDTQPLATLIVTHLTEASSTAEDEEHDIPLVLEFAPNTATGVIPVNALTPRADLVLTKTDNPDPVSAGGTLVYTLRVDNNGPDDAQDVVVTDNLPMGVTFVSTSGCAEDPVAVPTCTLGTVANNSFKSYTITVTVNSNTFGNITNTASVTSSTAEDNPGDETDSATTTSLAPAASADLAITLSDSPDPVEPGGTLTYTMTVTNNGPDSASNVAITSTLPGSVTLVSTTGCNEDPNGAPTCSLGTLGNGASAMVTMVTTVSGSASGSIANSASVASSASDPVSGNNTANASTSVVTPGADLHLEKSDSPDPVDAGSQLTYTVSVDNNGPNAAEDVVVTDNLPAGVTFVSTSGCAEDPAGVPTCTLGTIASSGNASYTILVDVDSDTLGMISNMASATSSTTELNPGDESDTEVTTVVKMADPTADLAVTKTSFPNAHMVGIVMRYTIVVDNQGPSDSVGNTVNDTFPAAVTGVSWTCAGVNGGSCGNGSGSGDISGELVDLPAGSRVVYTAVGTVTGSDTSITNTASAAVPVGVIDPDGGNNTDSVTTETDDLIFFDSFESGDTTSWSNAVPPPSRPHDPAAVPSP